jgi:DNA-binding Lrp family transcriptional regulator
MSSVMTETATRTESDRQILDLLRQDVRMTRRRMAEVTGLPESTIRARLDRVLRTGRVQATVLVHPQLERTSLVYMLHLELGDDGDVASLLQSDELIDAPWVGQVATTGELVVQQRAAGIEEMLARIEQVRLLPGVDHVWSVIVFRVYVGANWQRGTTGAHAWAAIPTREVDEIDLRLIAALRRDGRTSYTDLAEFAQLTVAATRRRVLRLVEDGVIRFTARVEDDAAVFEASIDIRVSGGRVREVIDDLCSRPDIRYVSEQSGPRNIACYVAGADSGALLAAVEGVRGDPRVDEAVVSPIVRLRDFVSWDGAR